MSNYVKATDFASKDALLSGNPAKIIKGTEIDDEYNAIAVAVNTKADLVSPTFTGTPLAPTASPGTNNTQLATTAFVTAADVAAITAERTATATITNKTLTAPVITNANATITSGSITGITDLAVADGGTGRSTLTADNVILGDGTNAVKFVAPGTSGNVLTSNGTTWSSTALPDQGVGVGQTWQDLTGSRAFNGTVYQNTTGKPIMINVSYYNGNKAGHYLYARAIGAPSWILIGDAGDRDFGGQNTISAIIPDNWEYKSEIHGDVWADVWSELR
jgi:hypothetical protein